jgi:hypothetical protein
MLALNGLMQCVEFIFTDAKIVHVLTFLSTMFNNKKFAKKQNQELVHQLKVCVTVRQENKPLESC